MVTYTEGLYLNKAWNHFLTVRGIDWVDIQRKLGAAEAQVHRENIADTVKSNAKNEAQRRTIFGAYTRSELAGPDTLQEMRTCLHTM